MARRRNPFPALIAVALVPALLLGGCWRFAASNVPDEVDVASPGTSTGSTPISGPGSTASSVPDSTTTVLTTPLMSVRRQPGTLSRDVNIEEFTAAMEAFLPKIDDTSCVAVSVDGQPVTGKHQDVSLRPASNVKLFTAPVALQVLGPTFTYRTEVRGQVTGGVVAGDLYLKGGGDPLLSSAWW